MIVGIAYICLFYSEAVTGDGEHTPGKTLF